MSDTSAPEPRKIRRHEVLDSQGRPSAAEGEDPDDARGHEVLDAGGRPSQAEGEDDD
jgi:hypothetical protein